MARIETDPNYTVITFPRATAGTDLFKKEDVQKLAEAMSVHDHTLGKGLSIPASALVDASIPSSKLAMPIDVPGHIRVTGAAGSAGVPPGPGVTLSYASTSGGVGTITAYDGAASVYKQLDIIGTGVNIFNPSGARLGIRPTTSSAYSAGTFEVGDGTAGSLLIGDTNLTRWNAGQLRIMGGGATGGLTIEKGNYVLEGADTRVSWTTGNSYIQAGGAGGGFIFRSTNGAFNFSDHVGTTVSVSFSDCTLSRRSAQMLEMSNALLLNSNYELYLEGSAGHGITWNSVGNYIHLNGNSLQYWVAPTGFHFMDGGGMRVAGNIGCQGQGPGTYGFQAPNSAADYGRGYANLWVDASSIDFKENIQDVRDPLQLLLEPDLRGVEYDHSWTAPESGTRVAGQPKSGTTHHIGFVADWWLPHAPEVVATDANGKAVGMAYGRVTPILWEAMKRYVQDTNARLEALEAQLAATKTA